MHARRITVAATLCCLAGLASAQQLQPGLWEITSRMGGPSGGEMEKAMAQAQAQMANLPPEQRKMIQDMMAKQGVGLSPAANAVRICLTPDMVARDQLPAQQGDCKTTQSPRSGNTIKVSFSCTRPVSSGEGTVTFVSPRDYKSTMKVRSTQNGRTDTLDMDSTGKWLAADCAGLKPPSAPAK
ncbi:MAG: DUF3617 domain-containing protein [Burkholderiaceae bacterium]|nr:DUF3617 domain-containing protein [Burkholderiaceae bacterium]